MGGQYLVYISACGSHLTISESIVYELPCFLWLQLFFIDDVDKVCFLLLLHILLPSTIHIFLCIDLGNEAFYQVFLAPQLHTCSYCLTDIHQQFLVLAVAVVILLEGCL